MPAETVLVTGASSGIGWELAKLFAADRYNLVLVARQREKLETLAEEFRREHGVEVRVLVEDLADPKGPQTIFDTLAAEGLHVAVLVNNAGFAAAGAVADLPLERQLDMIRVNVLALTHLSGLFLPGMIERRSGGILNVASTAAFQPGPYLAVYYATKAYVLSFTEALAEELLDSGVRVTLSGPRSHGDGIRRHGRPGGQASLSPWDDGRPDRRPGRLSRLSARPRVGHPGRAEQAGGDVGSFRAAGAGEEDHEAIEWLARPWGGPPRRGIGLAVAERQGIIVPGGATASDIFRLEITP